MVIQSSGVITMNDFNGTNGIGTASVYCNLNLPNVIP